MVTIFLSLLLMACTSQFQEHQSTSVDIVPIKFSMQLNNRNEGYKKSKMNIDSFINHHKEQLLAQNIIIKYSNHQAKKLAGYVQSLLLKKGVSPSMIMVRPETVSNDSDFEISYTEHKVQVPICTYEQIEKLGGNSANCVSEGARWKSMLHPNKMLLSQSNSL